MSRATTSRLNRVRSEGGFTLVELIVTMALLMIVMVAVSASFVSGTTGEQGVEQREKTESDARAALSRMRDDIHCAYALQGISSANGGFTLQLTEKYNTCQAVDSSTSGSSQVYLAWCTVPDPTKANVFDLYRANGTCDSTGTLEATDIVAPAGGWATNASLSPSSWAGNLWPTSLITCASNQTGYLPTVGIDLAVNAYTQGTPNGAYELKDQIAMRNATRCNTSGSSGGTTVKVSPSLSLTAPTYALSGTAIASSSIVATLSGSSSPTAQITFYAKQAASTPTVCGDGTWTNVGTATPSADGTFSPSGNLSNPTTGTYYWYAVFAGDSGNNGTSSSCGISGGMPTTTVVASKATPTVLITAPSVGTTGVAIPGSALGVTISGGYADTGTITLYYYAGASNPTTCPGGAGWTTLQTFNPTGAGSYTASSGINSPAANTYWWYAAYSGDGTDNAVNTLCNSSSMQKTVVAAFSGSVSSVSMLDKDHDGRVDEIDVVFSVAISCSGSCTTGWTLGGSIPSGATLSSVTVSSSTAKLILTEGAGAQDTTAGSTTVTLAAPNGIVDANGRYASFGPTSAVDKAAPIATNVVLANGGTLGKADAGDTVTVTYSEPLKPSTLCSAWSSSSINQTATSVTLTITKSSGALTVSTPGAGCGTWTGGSIAPGGSSYASATMTLTGSTLAWNATNKTLTITLGSLGSGTAATSIAAAVPSYTATTSITDLAPTPNAMSTGPYSGTSSRF